ncbi:MAG: NAD-dependent epimerase/dehydratase family protein [Alphaproteobacteria bacterium]|nr:NAD-dependent epimerase/dehydratase family protein [Alphaproteobacteria bacterium]
MTVALVERAQAPVLVTGGAGFIGTNLTHRLLAQGRRVRLLDSLARPGTERNLRWLRAQHGAALEFIHADLRMTDAVRDAVAGVAAVFHFAAQVAVTTSLSDPRDDFAVNAAGTVNLLEALRERGGGAGLIFTSTNKVYGAIDDIAMTACETRYSPIDGLASRGIGEDRALSFHSPYGCSKGAADQYVLDYARSYGMPNAVFRMSCIYGPHQHGTEDQGWVAHFLIRAARGLPITIYGDGKQVRDILYVDDLIEALLLAERHLPRIAGEAFNIGGGPDNTTSLCELIARIAELNGFPPEIRRGDWRVGDQRWYVSDIGKFATTTGWRPRVGVAEGVDRLHAWLKATDDIAPAMRAAAR